MEWLKKIAPTLVSCLMGPAAGLVVEGVGSLLGISEATVDQVKIGLEKAQMSEEQLVKLRQMEADLKAKEMELGFKFSELEFKDKDSARQMQMATMSRIPAILAIGVTGGYFAILWWLMNGGVPPNSEPLMLMLGSLGTAWGSIIAFYFGSTHGGQVKTQLLAQSSPGK